MIDTSYMKNVRKNRLVEFKYIINAIKLFRINIL